MGQGAIFNLAGGYMDNYNMHNLGGNVAGGNALFAAGAVTLGSGSALEVTGGYVNDNGVGALAGTATTGAAAVSIGSLNGSGSVSVWGGTAGLQVDSGYYTGVIAGDTTFLMNGPGTLVLDGVNTYSGNTTVSAGELVVGDSPFSPARIPGNTAVSAGATLAGCGTVAGTLTNAGELMPGYGGVGTLTVGGYTQTAAGTLAINLSPSQSTTLNVAGTANLTGALTVTASGNFGVKYTYALLTAWNPLAGKFTDYGYDLPADFTAALDYGSNQLTLTLTRNNTDFTAFAQTANETAVAQALNQGVTGASTDLINKMNALYTQSSGQAGVLEQLGGAVYTALPNLTVENAQFGTGLLLDRLEGNAPGGSFGGTAYLWNPGPYADAAASDADFPGKARKAQGYWLEQLDSFGSLDGDNEVAGFNQASYGLLGGYETQGVDGLVTGFAVGYDHTNLTSQGQDGAADVDTWQGDLYGKYRFNDVELSAVLGYGYNQYQVTRPIGTGIQAAGSFTGNQLTAAFQAAEHLGLAGLNPEIRAGVEYAFVETAAFTERNADSYDLSVPEVNTYSLRPYVGLGFAPEVASGGLELTPVVKVTVAEEALTPSAQQVITLAGAAQSPFTINGVTPDQAIIGAEAGLGLKLESHLKLFAAYDGYFGGNETLHTVSGGLNFGF
jgi:autotransporter-associated beta strand protein